MIARLRDNQVVFVGETHIDEVTHRVELALLKGLHQSGRSVVVSLEMFGRDRQGILDDYLAGAISEDEFLAGSDPWNNYETGYRPIIEWARNAGVPVIAANVPRPVWRKVAFGGGLEALRRFYAEEHNLIFFPCGGTGVQMGGWFTKEINTVNDIRGLKMRIPGISGKVFAALGGEQISIAGGEILPAIETGAIDAAEFVGPTDDLILGLDQFA